MNDLAGRTFGRWVVREPLPHGGRARNPFPLIDALYGRPELLAARASPEP